MRAVAISLIFMFLAGCSSHTTGPNVANFSVTPQALQQQGGGPWLSFPMGGSRIIEAGESIAAGFDGNIWVCDSASVDRVDMAGAVTSFAVPSCSGITRDPNGHLYFRESPSQLGTVDASGNIGSLGLDGGVPPQSTLASDAQGNLWAGSGEIEKIDSSGHVTAEDLVYPPGVGGTITGLVYGSDGEMWFSCLTAGNQGVPCIGEISLDMSAYQIWLLPGVSNPIAASDNGIWFFEGDSIARMDPGTKAIATYSLSQTYNVDWGTQATPALLAFVTRGRQLLQFDIKTHAIAGKPLIAGMVDGTHSFVTLGPDKNLWIGTDVEGPAKFHFQETTLDVFILRAMTTVPTIISLKVDQTSPLSVAEKHYMNPTFTAVTSNALIATVAPGNNAQSFVVTALSSGNCDITVSDRLGNSIAVPVSVQ